MSVLRVLPAPAAPMTTAGEADGPCTLWNLMAAGVSSQVGLADL